MRTNRTITIQRLQPQAVGSNINVWVTIGTFRGFMQVADIRDFVNMDLGAIGQLHTIYCLSSIDIRETDRLIIDTIQYLIKGIKRHDVSLGDRLNHLKILVYKE